MVNETWIGDNVDNLFQERARRIAQVAQELEENHECGYGEHSRRFQRVAFSRRSGGGECNLCGTRHRVFLLECRRCPLRLCAICRQHGDY
jgi:hypothetical protein